jgi:uncharacterized protein
MNRKNPPPEFDPDEFIPPPIQEGPERISSLALDVSGECNLACQYCAEKATQPKRPAMPDRILEDAWHFLFPNGTPEKYYSFRFGSGEPLLAFPILKRLESLVKESGGSFAEERPSAFITTNGTLLDGMVKNWLVSGGWNVKVSLDGPQHVHDRWRITGNGEGTYRGIAEHTRDLASRLNDRFSVTAVLCRGADPKKVFNSIANLGVRRIELVPAVHKARTILPGRTEVEQYERFVKSYARRWVEYEGDDSPPMLVGFEKFVVRVMGYALSRISCGAGRSFIGVGPEGDLYPCFRFIGIRPYKIGHLTEGLDLSAAKAFQNTEGRPYEQRTPCQECWAAPLCGGPCFACAEMFGPGDGQPFGLHCAYRLADAAAAVSLVRELRERDPVRLLSFLPGSSELMRELV